VPELRVTGTIEALEAATRAGLLASGDKDVLIESWTQAMRVRDAIVQWTGRSDAKADNLPHDSRALAGVSRILGYEPGAAAQLEEDRLRTARRARTVFERLFYS